MALEMAEEEPKSALPQLIPDQEEELPLKVDPEEEEKAEDEEKRGEDNAGEKEEDEGRQCRKITACPHFLRQHYAKGMCKLCYAKRGREKRAWKCPHTDKPLYAKGRC